MGVHVSVRSTIPVHPRQGSTGLARFGFGVAVATGVLTAVTFGLALTALPDKVPYPFTDPVIAQQWPGDYSWMYAAMVLMVLFVALVAAVHERAPSERKVFSQVALVLAGVAAAVLLIDYYVQVSVLPISLEKGQLDGWAMLTQYNPNGVFIALEELGYLLMSLALLALVPALSPGARTERMLRWLFTASACLVVVSLAAVTLWLGRDRGDVFEIAVISLVWLTLLVASPLLALVFRRGPAHAVGSREEVHPKVPGQRTDEDRQGAPPVAR